MNKFSKNLGLILLIVTPITMLIMICLVVCFRYPSKQFILTMIDFYQLLMVTLVFRFDFPTSLTLFIHKFGIFKLDFRPTMFLEDPSLISKLFSGSIEQQNAQLYDLGYKSRSFLDNYIYLLLFLLFIASLDLIFFFIKNACVKESKSEERSQGELAKKIRSSNNCFHVGLYLMLFCECLTFALLNLINEVRTSSGDKASLAISWICSLICIVICILLSARVLIKETVKLNESYFRYLYDGIETNVHSKRAYYFSFLLRRLLLCSSIICIQHSKAQWVVCFGIQCVTFMYYSLIKPFKLQLNNFNLILCELILTVLLVCMLSIPDYKNNNYNKKSNEILGVVCCCIVFVGNIVVLISTLTHTSITLYKRYNIVKPKYISSQISENNKNEVTPANQPINIEIESSINKNTVFETNKDNSTKVINRMRRKRRTKASIVIADKHVYDLHQYGKE